jgi:LacI family transcriptional regulator
VVEVVEAHDDPDEAFQKCLALLQRPQKVHGIYVTTANCLPVCRAFSALRLSGKTTLITSDLFREMVTYFEKGTIFASIYAHPHLQGQVAMTLIADHLLGEGSLPDRYYLPPQIVMRSTVRQFRETRSAGPDSTLLPDNVAELA